jgi:hypothetical protein
MGRDMNWILCSVWKKWIGGTPSEHLPYSPDVAMSPHAIFGSFQPWKGSSNERNFEVINGLQHVFEKWVERCKKCIPTQSNKVSPWTSQTALVYHYIQYSARSSPAQGTVSHSNTNHVPPSQKKGDRNYLQFWHFSILKSKMICFRN